MTKNKPKKKEFLPLLIKTIEVLFGLGFIAMGYGFLLSALKFLQNLNIEILGSWTYLFYVGLVIVLVDYSIKFIFSSWNWFSGGING